MDVPQKLKAFLLKRVVEPFLARTQYQVVVQRQGPTLELTQLGLAYHLLAGRHDAAVVQVGACDGRAGDPIHHLISRGDTRAILVEPIPSNFVRLQKAYGDVSDITLVNAAVSDHDGPMKMFRVRESGRWAESPWAPQLASFSRNHLLLHGIAEDEIEEVLVEGLTLGTLLDRHSVTSVGFLQVDVEGFDATVVRMALGLPEVPSMIGFEHVHLKEARAALYKELRESGYRWANDEFNTLAVHQRVVDTWTHPVQSTRFNAPPRG